jgi:monoamine oxidase
MYGEAQVNEAILENQIHVTRWSLDETSLGAYSVASPGNWDKHEILGKPVGLEGDGRPRVFFAGEGTAHAIYDGSYPGAYESGMKAARDIHAEMLHSRDLRQ